jgi:predicted transposase/invertase (TIGR01784 family)
MDYEILPPTDDWIFKLLFGDERNKSMLADLLKSLVDLPQEEYDLSLLDSSLKPEAEDDKLGIVDVKVRTKSGKIIDIEIQVNPVKHIGKRLSFYKSKLIVEQIGKSELYSVIQRVICICITKYELFTGVEDYLNSFRFYNPKNGLCLRIYRKSCIPWNCRRCRYWTTGAAAGNGCNFYGRRRRRSLR